MDRRQFILACCGTTAALLIASCSNIYYATNALSGNQISVALSEFDETKDGVTTQRAFVLVKNEKLRFPIAVYKSPEGKYRALYLECTHRGCEVKAASTGLQCPCHGSEFSTEGKVLNPPAEKDLAQFPVSISGDYLLIQLSAT